MAFFLRQVFASSYIYFNIIFFSGISKIGKVNFNTFNKCVWPFAYRDELHNDCIYDGTFLSDGTEVEGQVIPKDYGWCYTSNDEEIKTKIPCFECE